MTLPSSFSSFDHLQDVVRRVHNRLVREEFSDIGGDDWDPDITTPRGSLRTACLLADNDTGDMVQMRYNLFYFDLRKAKDLQTPVYGMPLPDVQASRKFKPQITLKFCEDASDVDEGKYPVWGEISFRLMTINPATFSKTDSIALGKDIKRIFGAGNGYVWKKGKKYFSYTKKEEGYQLQVLARDKSVAKNLVEKVLDIKNKTPDWRYFKTNETEEELEAYPYTPPTHTVMGEVIREPTRRPNVDVRFQWAELDLWGKGRPLILYDRSFTHIDALVDDYSQ